ncbi:hypothetical protein vseg_017100 [Gypsophila vaccaria]
MSKNNLKIIDDDKKLVIVLVPYLAQSHLNMLYQLSRLIVSTYDNIRVHYVSSTQHIKQLKLRNPGTIIMGPSHNNNNNNNNTDDVIFHDYFVPSCDALDDVFRTVPHLGPPVCDLVRGLSNEYGKVVVVHDALMASVVQDVSGVDNVESYTFNTVSTFSFFVNSWRIIPKKPFELDPPNAIPSDLPSVSENCLPTDFTAFIRQQWTLNFAIDVGTLYNGSRAVDGTYVRLLEKLYPHRKHFAVGPAICKQFVLNYNASQSSDGKSEETHRCLNWLDQQEKDSVIYISFGTTTTIPEKQIHEIATGLERSGHKFIWVLRESDKGDIFTDGDDGNHADEDEAKKKRLPEGFFERVGNKQGMVITGEWVPQLEILGHPAVGGFMTHCGWGSLLESMTMGVPVIAYPMHSDQPLNSVLVTQVLRIGFLIKDNYWETRWQVTSSDIMEKAVKRLMGSEEGEGMRRRAKDIGQALRGSMAQGGATQLDLDSFIAHISRPNDQSITN